MLRYWAAAAVAALLAVVALQLDADPSRGRSAAFAVGAGAAFGFVLQRSRFCFASSCRDLFLLRDRRLALGVLAALAAGSIGSLIVFPTRVPDPMLGWLPETAHIAPAGWHLLAGGAAFGVGMVLAGGCISGNLYRLGEGSLVAPVVLLATLGGYWLGFLSWSFLYTSSVATAPVVWLPAKLGYTGALAVQLGAIALLAALLLARFSGLPPRPAEAATLRSVLRRVFVQGWPAWAGGLAIGVLATVVYLRTTPLGVTAQIGALARASGQALGIVPQRLEGLDQIAGCRTTPGSSLLGDNGIFVMALVAGSLLAALLAGEFKLRAGRPRAYVLGILGGMLLGFGAMISLGCTVGTMLSGITALSLSGWVFLGALLAGAWAGGRVLRWLA